MCWLVLAGCGRIAFGDRPDGPGATCNDQLVADVLGVSAREKLAVLPSEDVFALSGRIEATGPSISVKLHTVLDRRREFSTISTMATPQQVSAQVPTGFTPGFTEFELYDGQHQLDYFVDIHTN